MQSQAAVEIVEEILGSLKPLKETIIDVSTTHDVRVYCLGEIDSAELIRFAKKQTTMTLN